MSRTMPLSQLLPEVALVRDISVSGLVMDSRELQPGDAFVAIGGFGTNGLAFVEQARAQGAAAILFEPPAPEQYPAPADAIAVPGLRARLGQMGDLFHDHPSHAMTMVGVTGTNGKTSTVQLLAQAWQLRGIQAGSIGTLGAGRYGQVQPTGFTTPLVLRMHALLAGLRDDGVQAVAMEVSSHALDQGRVDGVHYDVAVFTNLTRDHLDYHGDMASYGGAKARLFTRPGLKAAVLNLDDAFGRTLHGNLAPTLQAVGVSSRGQPGAAVQARALRLDNHGIGFDLVIGDRVQAVRSPLLGRFNVDNLLAVAGVLHALGDDLVEIAAILPQLQPVPGRMTRLGGDGRLPLVVIDYAHTPDALAQALSSEVLAVGERSLAVTASIGGVQVGEKIASVAQILAKASQCLAAAVELGGNTVQVFDPGAADRAEEERIALWVERIGQALAGEGFVLHWQPVMSLQGEPGELYEACLRVEVNGELVTPSGFLGIAEEHGLLAQIDRWVVRRVIEVLGERERAGRKTGLIARVSPASFAGEELVQLVRAELAAQGVPGERLWLEAPEARVFTHLRSARQFLDAVAPLGCRVGLEQFGSGLDSFQMLAHFKPAFVKIDPGLTDGVGKGGEGQDKVRAITARARAEGIVTVAERVDDAQAMSQLFSAGVEYVSGDFVAPVGPAMNFDFG